MNEKRHSDGSCRNTRMPGSAFATAAIRQSALDHFSYSGASGVSS
ncbi:MAG: hypothetical protein VXW31_08270 [Planctomycetota bacterium]|nr:hypothetical protein [Planctomycetota bacterium]